MIKERKALIVMMKMNEIVNKVYSLIQKDSIEELSVIYNTDSSIFIYESSSRMVDKKENSYFQKNTHEPMCSR